MSEKSFQDLAHTDDHRVEKRVSGEDVYSGIFLKMKRDTVLLPDGQQALREYLEHPGAVAILPILEDGRILVERQYRYPIEQAVIEIPAGKLNVGEDPLLCAQRELQEETGYIAKRWSKIRRIHPVISYSTEFIDIYLAEGLTAGPARLAAEEVLDVFAAPLEELIEWVENGTITAFNHIIASPIPV